MERFSDEQLARASTAELLALHHQIVQSDDGDQEEAIRIMTIAMDRKDANKDLYEHFRMKPRSVNILVDDGDGNPRFVRIAE